MMRQFFPLLTAVLVVAALAGCGEGNDHRANNSSRTKGVNVGSVFPACYKPHKLTSVDVADHRCTWPAFALKLQRKLDRDKPLEENLVLATHNSFNVEGRAGFSSKFDPNQVVSMADQLRLSMRGLEIDVHWIKSNPGNRFEPLMCHGTSNHVPCTGDEPRLRIGLRDIRDWLYAHPKQFIILDLQAEFDGKTGAFNAAGQTLENTLGNLIYRPANGNCASIPLGVSPNHILASGSQVLVTGKCGPEGTSWRTVVHSTDVRVQRNNAVGDKFTAYPDCDSEHFTAEDYAKRWTRLWEDTTQVAVSTGASGQINGQDLRRMLNCGINEPSLDKLTPQDPRFPSMVWSWAEGQPAQSRTDNCAVHNANGRFVAADCSRVLPFACYDAATQSWSITKHGGQWLNGSKACAGESDGAAVFAVPFNARDNEKLKAAKKTGNFTAVWLNYSDRGRADGDWPPNPLTAKPAIAARPRHDRSPRRRYGPARQSDRG